MNRLKLKRGLADISPLFSRTAAASVPRAKIVAPVSEFEESLQPARRGAEIFYVWSSDEEGDAHFLNHFFASKLIHPSVSALLMKIEENPGCAKVQEEAWSRSLKHMSVPAAHLNSLQHQSVKNMDFPATHVFIEMPSQSLIQRAEVLSVLDHLVIFVKPQIESITEAYRRLKAMRRYGLQAEISLLFDADDSAGVCAALYEHLSEFISAKLTLPASYLGTLHLSRGSSGLKQDICWEAWNACRSVRPQSLEKTRFLNWAQSLGLTEAARS